jgi:hypothetical protein
MADEYTEVQQRAFRETSLHPNVIVASTDEELLHEIQHQEHDKPKKEDDS